MKKFIYLIAIFAFATFNSMVANSLFIEDHVVVSINQNDLIIISDVAKVKKYAKLKGLSDRAADQVKLADEAYTKGVQLMHQSELCILSCGTMILEACALGVPSIGLAVAENQKSTAEFLASSGAIELYDFNNEKDLSIYRVILDFINNPKKLSLCSKKLKTMVSSDATEIIARRLCES